MSEKDLDGRDIPELVSFAMGISNGILFDQGNLIEPVVFYRKNGQICEFFMVQIPRELLGSDGIRDRVIESVRQFVVEKGPDELVLAMEGFFVGDYTKTRCASLIFSTPSGERTWVAALGGDQTGPWREILVKTGDFYQLYEKSTYRWN